MLKKANEMLEPRILAVLIRPDGGSQIWGAEKSFVEIARNITSQGAVVTSVEWPPAISRHWEVPFRTFELKGSPGRLQSFRMIFDTIRVCRRSKSDAIYAYSLYFRETVVSALVAALVLRKPLFVSVNDDKRRDEDETSLFRLLRKRIGSSRSVSSNLNYMAYHVARRLICRKAKACFATTPYVGEFVRTVLRGRRVIVVGRGLGSHWFENPIPGGQIPEKPIDAAFLGRVDLPKGIDTLLKAWRLVVDSRRDARLLVMGAGDYLEKAKELSRAMGMERNVIFTGYVADEGVIRNNLRSSKVFIFPSRKEGFANAVAQAMACGLPCVISDIPELRSFYGEYSLLATADSPSSFSNAVLELLSDGKKREYYGAKGMSFAQTLKWPIVASKMLQAMEAT